MLRGVKNFRFIYHSSSPIINSGTHWWVYESDKSVYIFWKQFPRYADEPQSKTRFDNFYLSIIKTWLFGAMPTFHSCFWNKNYHFLIWGKPGIIWLWIFNVMHLKLMNLKPNLSLELHSVFINNRLYYTIYNAWNYSLLSL